MKGRQVRFVLMALIAVGIAGLILRAVSSSSDELVLSGLLPLARDIVNRVEIRSQDSETELVRIGENWTTGTYPVFSPKLEQFWAAVAQMDGAQLIATNPANHERMRVTPEQGTRVAFYLGQSIQEQFIIGAPTVDVQFCFVKRSGQTEVYGVQCPAPNIFDADPDGWRDPVIAAISPTEVESITFTYPNEEFVLRLSDGEWIVTDGVDERPADLFQLDTVIRSLVMVASGFADEDETKGLKFDSPDLTVSVATRAGATTPSTRIRFFERDDGSFHVRVPTQPTVFIVDKLDVDPLLKRMKDFLLEPIATPTLIPATTPTLSALSLKEYMVRAFRAQTDMLTLNNDLVEALSGGLENAQRVRQINIQFNLTMSQTLDQAFEALSDVRPPPDAEAYHGALLAMFGNMRAWVDQQAVALETRDPSRLQAAMTRLLALVEESVPVGQQGTDLVIRALEAERDEPLNVYLIAATKSQQQMLALLGNVFTSLSDAQQQGDPDAVLAVYGDMIAILEQTEGKWAQLVPPFEASDLHRRHVESIADQIRANRQLVAVIREQDEAGLLKALQLLLEVGAESSRMAADWNELLIKALSR